MTTEITQRQDILEFSSVGILEMAGTGQTIDVPVDPRIDITALTANDPDPKFVNFEILRTGISKTNRRKYSSQVVHQVNDMAVGVQMFLGHPDPSKTSFEFREPHSIVVGSTVQEMADGVTRSIGKAYLFTTSPLREWVPKSIATGKPLTVSINGSGDVYRDTVNNVIDVKRMAQLDSIDWANPGTEGMGTSKAFSVVSELQDDKGGDPMSEPTRQDLVRGVTIAEMRAFNPELVGQTLSGVTIAELQASNPKLVESIENAARITEMQLTVDGKATTVKLDGVQAILDGKDTKIAELQGEIAQGKITEMRSTLVAELVPEQLREKVASRVTGDTKESITTSINTELTFIKEIMGADAFDNLPKGKPAHKDGGDMEAAVKNLFGVKENTKK